MIDPKYLRQNPEVLKNLIALGRGNPEKANVDKWLELDKQRTDLVQKRDEINKKRNELAKLGKDGDREKIKEEGKYLRDELQKIEEQLGLVENDWQNILDWMPNVPIEPMPEGAGEPDNITMKVWLPGKGYIQEAEGTKARGFTEKYFPEFPLHAKEKDFTPRHHLDIGKDLGVIDNEQGAKVSGSRFTYLIGDLAILQYAIQQHLFNELIQRGFKPFISPLLVRERVLYGSSHFPEGKSQVYSINNENVEDSAELYLVGSTEPSNFAYFMDRTMEEASLPYKLFAYAPAFRSEAGSWGKDMKGIKRLHQFDKIEMNCVCTPEQSMDIFWELLGINEWLLQSLELPYQLARKCTGDAGYLASSFQIDPEVWLSGQKEFMEVMTDTNTTDYQARRLNIKYKKKTGGLEFCHTVNDTGVAMGRILIAIMDNYQQKDGSVMVPKVLQKYTGFEIIKKI